MYIERAHKLLLPILDCSLKIPTALPHCDEALTLLRGHDLRGGHDVSAWPLTALCLGQSHTQ